MRAWVFARSLLWLLAILPIPALAGPYTDIYVLGDSLSDQGNLLAATSVLGPPVGQPLQPDPLHYYAGRFSNGEVYAGLLAQKLGLTLGPSLLGGNNFAFGGARTDYNTVEVPPFGSGVFPRGAYPWSLNAERQAFVARVAQTGADPHALGVVFSGSNDVGDILLQRLDPASTIAKAVAGVISVVDAFKAAGVETVLVPNLPDLGVIPRVTELEAVSPGISATATRLTAQFNAVLQTALEQETGIRIVSFDTFDFLRDVVENPGKYGFLNSTQACYSGFVLPDPSATVCSNPDQYVFWDVEHPTTRFHDILADEMLAAVTAVPEPSGLAPLALGLTALGLIRRTAGRRGIAAHD